MTDKNIILAATVTSVGLLLILFTAYFVNKYFKCRTCKRRTYRGCLRKCNPCVFLLYRHNTYDDYPLPMIHTKEEERDSQKPPHRPSHPPKDTKNNNTKNTTLSSIVIHDGIPIYPTPGYIPPSTVASGIVPNTYGTTLPQSVYPSTFPSSSTSTTNGTTTTTTIVYPFPEIPSTVVRPSTVTNNPLWYPTVPSYYYYPSAPPVAVLSSRSSTPSSTPSPLPDEMTSRLPSLPIIDQPGIGIVPTVHPPPTPITIPSPSPSPASSSSYPLSSITSREQQRMLRQQIEQLIPIELHEVYTYPVEQGKQWYQKKQTNQTLVHKTYRKIDRQYEERLIVMALLRARWALLTPQELADYVRRIPGLSVPYNPSERLTASSPKEALWEALVRWAEDRSVLPPNVVPILSQSFENHSIDTLRNVCTYYDLPTSGRPLDLWDRLESYFALTSTRPEPSLALRTRPVYARYSQRLTQPWWLREGYTGEEAMPIELAVDGTSIYHHAFWLYQDGRIQETSDTLERWFPVLEKEKHREWQGNEDDTNALRRKICGSLLIRSKCWDEIDTTNDTLTFRQYIQQTIGNTYRTELPDHFRADDYGNIVSDIAGNNAIARFDPDHGFPWIRGGLTVVENLRALHFAANRWGKKHALVIAEPNMHRGIHAKDFADLYVAARKWCEEQPRNSSILLDLSNPNRNHGHVKKHQQAHEARVEPVTTINMNQAAWALVTKVLCRTLDDKQVITNWNDYRRQYTYDTDGWQRVLLDLAKRIKDD